MTSNGVRVDARGWGGACSWCGLSIGLNVPGRRRAPPQPGRRLSPPGVDKQLLDELSRGVTQVDHDTSQLGTPPELRAGPRMLRDSPTNVQFVDHDSHMVWIRHRGEDLPVDSHRSHPVVILFDRLGQSERELNDLAESGRCIRHRSAQGCPEPPAVAFRIRSSVLPSSVGLVDRRMIDGRTRRPGLVTVGVDVFDNDREPTEGRIL